MADCNPTSESPREEKYLWIVPHFAKLPFKMPVLIYPAISNFLRPAHLCSLVSISYYHLNILANLIGENDFSILRSYIYLITSKWNGMEYSWNLLPCVFTSYTSSLVSSLFIFYLLGTGYVFFLNMYEFYNKDIPWPVILLQLFTLWSVVLIFYFVKFEKHNEAFWSGIHHFSFDFFTSFKLRKVCL